MKILHKRTSAYTEPTIITLERGEIGMTTDNTNPRLYISKNDDSVAEFVDKSYIDKKIADISSSTTSYKLQMDENGVLSCVKNGNGEGFTISSDGVLSLN